jgi:hypothetical protein
MPQEFLFDLNDVRITAHVASIEPRLNAGAYPRAAAAFV